MTFRSWKRLSYMSDFNTGQCHNAGGCLFSNEPLIIFLQECCNFNRGPPYFSYLSASLVQGALHCNIASPMRMSEFTLRGTSICRLKMEKRLPKYGSQSETMIDSGLWLRTTTGQTKTKRKHRTHNIECPPQLTPWLNQDRDLKGQGVTSRLLIK